MKREPQARTASANRKREPPTHKRKSQRIKSALAMPAIFFALAPGSDENERNGKAGKKPKQNAPRCPPTHFDLMPATVDTPQKAKKT